MNNTIRYYIKNYCCSEKFRDLFRKCVLITDKKLGDRETAQFWFIGV